MFVDVCSIGFGSGDNGLGLAKDAKFNKDIIVWHGVACRVLVCRAEGRRMFRVPNTLQYCKAASSMVPVGPIQYRSRPFSHD